MSMDKIFEKYKKPKISYSEFKEKNHNNLYKFTNTKKIKKYSRMKLCLGAFALILMMSLTIIFISNINKKVSVNFIIEGTSYIVKMDKGSSINKDIIPLSNKNYVVKLYYDEEAKIEYSNESVKEDTTIFVEINEIDVTLVVIHKNIKIKVKENDSIKKEDLVEYAKPYEIEGLYYDCRYTQPYNEEEITKETTIFVDTNISLDTAKPVGEILTLQEAYNKNILVIEDLYEIQNNIHDYCDNMDTYANIIDGIYPCEWISEDLIRQIVYDKESQLNPACEGCLEFELIKQYFIYFGTYNDGIVFRAEGCGSYIGTDWGANINIDGTIIHLPEGPNLYVWIPVETSN